MNMVYFVGSSNGIITGPTSVIVGSEIYMYEVSKTCPICCQCMWLLNNRKIFDGSDTSIKLTFDEEYIGRRTLSYLAYCGGNRQILASLCLFISSNSSEGKIKDNNIMK